VVGTTIAISTFLSPLMLKWLVSNSSPPAFISCRREQIGKLARGPCTVEAENSAERGYRCDGANTVSHRGWVKKSGDVSMAGSEPISWIVP